MAHRNHGFTIVELLIVIVVIAILAAIGVVAYTGIQDRALASTVKSDLANFAKKVELAKVDTSDGGYPAPPTPAMGIKVTKTVYIDGRYNWYYRVSPDHASCALGVVDTKNRGYYQSSIAGIEEVSGASVSQPATCAKVGASSGINGYSWNSTTSTGTWSAWTN